MKIDRSHPDPIDDEPVPTVVREYLLAARQSGPSDDAIQRMSSQLATAGVLPTAQSNGTAGRGAGRRLAYQKLGIIALVVSGGLVFSWRATRTERTTGTDAPAAASVGRSTVDPSRPADAAHHTDPEPLRSAESSRMATIAVDDLPAASPRVARTAGSATRDAMRMRVSSSGDTAAAPPATELELVKRAQAALASFPERALAITREQARAYPSGEFVQEREVIEVEALSRLGRTEEALRRAVALVQRFPRTPYIPRLQIAVGRPLTAPPDSAPPEPARSPGTAGAIPNP